MLNAWQSQRGITWDQSVLHPWRPVDDVTSIHWGGLRGQCWPTSGLSKTQRGTSLLPFPRGSGVTAAYKKRIPTRTLHPRSPSTPYPCTLLFCLEIPWNVCGISMTTATDSDGGDCVKRCSVRAFRQEWGRNVRVTRYKSCSRRDRMKILKVKAVKTCKREPEYKLKTEILETTQTGIFWYNFSVSCWKTKTNIHITAFIDLLQIHMVQWMITNAIQ